MSIIKIKDEPDLVLTSNFPSYSVFPFEKFNPVQSATFKIFNKDCNALIAAKTGAGKTYVSEQFIAHEINERKGKAVYLAPLKALAQEKFDDWTDEKSSFAGKSVAICSGDYRLTPSRKAELEKANILIFSNEMLNSRCRNFKSESNEFLKEIGTVVVDESHLLAMESRGSHLEVALMKLTEIAPHARLILMSATLPNVDQIATWMNKLNNKETYLLESEYKAVPVGIHYETYFSASSYIENEEEKIKTAVQILEDHPEDKFLMFVHTKKTGEMLKKFVMDSGYECEFHSADLNKEKRVKLEQKFKEGKLQVLVATSTVAWGCYEAGTIVNMANGDFKNIEDILVGDSVLAMGNDSFESKKVLKTGKKLVENSLRIKLATGEEFEVSEDHKFYGAIGRENVNYYKANQFKIGDLICTPCEVGFKDKNKKGCEDFIIHETDVIPARKMLQDHALKNKISPSQMMKNVNSDLWASLNKQDLNRGICEKLLLEFPSPSSFSELMKKPVVFRKIISISKKHEKKYFYDIEVEDLHNYIGNGVISHNCNLPARRVVILGVHRGMSEVEVFDINQMIGRSGRLGYDDRGDAYVLVPENLANKHIKRLSKQPDIISRLLDCVGENTKTPHYKTLAFFLVSEIHHGNIKTKDEINSWFSRSLAASQAQNLDQSIVDNTIDLLIKCGAIKEYDGVYKATVIGMISSLFYYSPFDVADLKRNFKLLFSNNLQNNDAVVAICLGDIDSQRMSTVSKDDKAEMHQFSKVISNIFGDSKFSEGAMKAGYAYYCLMNGSNPGSIANTARLLQFDFQRMAQVLSVIDNLSGKWNRKDFFKKIQLRIAYGVPEKLTELVTVENVGKVRAERLWAAGIRTKKDIVVNSDRISGILNVNANMAKSVIDSATNSVLSELKQ